MEAIRRDDKIHCRSIWISDVHLGSRHSKAAELLQLFERIEFETLYLVGDIVDLLAMKRRVHWPNTHNKVLREIMKLSRRKGSRVIYVPGNHDYAFRTLVGGALGDMDIKRSVEHVTACGRRLLVMHGDELDYAVRYSKLNRVLGDFAYGALMGANHWVVVLRRLLGWRYWSLAGWVKSHVSQASAAIAAYQDAALRMAREQGFDGVICGHLHYPSLHERDGLIYANDGDWVENCSALIEDKSGQLRLLRGISHPDTAEKMIFVDANQNDNPLSGATAR
ncbi:MAG: UDP-2,3-diacylglucosamine diphosphatase [Proteobacteria bacterium]|nr:UDP-2,3-diacylglucosamine diphosphatase [Pseudomonadota bacterium]